MNHSGEDRVDERPADDPAGGVPESALVDPDASEQDAEELGEDEAIDTSDFEVAIEDLDDPDSGFTVAAEALSEKEQNARALAARRAIEQRMEQKQLDEDLDYLDLDGDG